MISQNMLNLFMKKLQHMQSNCLTQTHYNQQTLQEPSIQHSLSLTPHHITPIIQNIPKNDHDPKLINNKDVGACFVQSTGSENTGNDKESQKGSKNKIFGFRVCPSPLFPDKNQKLSSCNQSKQKNSPGLLKKVQWINVDQCFIEEEKNYTSKIPHLYFMNNLISLYGKVHSNLIRMYIKQVSRKHKIPYNDILVSFGIEQMVAKFYQAHQLQCQLTSKYILSQMSINIPPFVAYMRISNWSLIRKIAQGAMNRFKIRSLYNDDWLMNQLKKKGKLQRQNGNNMERILTLSKLEGKDIDMSAHDKQVDNANYQKMKTYLPKQEQKVYKQIVFQETDEQLIEESNRIGIESKLKFYKNLKEKLIASKQKSKKQNKLAQKQKQDQLQQKQYRTINFFIWCMMLKVPDNAIFLQQHTQQENMSVNSNKSERQSSKYLTLKQKVRQKQLQKLQRNDRQKKRQRQGQAQKCTARKTIQSLSKLTKAEVGRAIQAGKHQEPASKDDKAQIEQWALKQLDFKLFEFHEKHPDFSMSDLLKQIYRILKQLKVPEKLYQKITAAWFNKYQKS